MFLQSDNDTKTSSSSRALYAYVTRLQDYSVADYM